LADIPASHEAPLALHCVICGTPLGGPVSLLFRLFGVGRSFRNPNLCSRCNTHVAEGDVKNLTVLFADLSGFTLLTGAEGAGRAFEVADAFLRMSTAALVRHGAYIDKYVGDAVMALFNAPITFEDHAARAVASAVEIHEGCQELESRFQRPVRSSIGIAAGSARVGRLGSEDARDVTAIGQSVNLAARLQAAASAGQTVLAHEVYQQVTALLPDVPPEAVTLKGFPEPVQVHRLPSGTKLKKGGPRISPYFERRHGAFTVGPLLLSLLGAPCAAAAFLGSSAVALGLGSLLGASAGAFFDDWRIRIPLLMFAGLGTVANIYALWYARRVRAGFLAHGRALAPSFGERMRKWLVVAAAMVTVFAMALEVFAHHFLMHHPGP